jgi:hypothetical protein
MNDIQLVAKEIELYLAKHPHAADSIEGIIKWWLSQQRYIDAHEKIAKALDYLVAQGVVKKVEITGSVLYSSKESASKEQEENTNELSKGKRYVRH